jgi:hypothetical protein
MISLAGVRRNIEFSPNHRGNDNAIYMLVAERLETLGCRIVHYTESEIMERDAIEEEVIFTMARSKAVVHKMQQWERKGKLIVNSATGIELCYRTNMTRHLIANNIPYPDSIIVSTAHPSAETFAALGTSNIWIKRGDFHAIHKEDVTFVKSVEEGIEMLREYGMRGIEEAVLSKHLHGDLIKFYGVAESEFFYWFYPNEMHHSKFNNEVLNGTTQRYAFNEHLLKLISRDAAAALSIDVFGGDAVISPNGDIHIIDLNDWPSFAPCREQAAEHIAARIYQKILTTHVH